MFGVLPSGDCCMNGRIVGFRLARLTALLVSLAFALLALAWLGLSLVVALQIGILGSPLYLWIAVLSALPAILPALAAWFYFDRARTATLEDA